MTATAAPGSTSTSSSPSRSRRALPWVLAALGVLVIAALAGSPNQEGPPYDPASTSPSGTKALVQLLGSFGAQVDVTADQPPPTATVAIAFPNTIPDDGDDAMRAWVAGGHTLVVADPNSPLSPFAGPADAGGSGVAAETFDQGECTVPALRDAHQLSLADDFTNAAEARLYPIPDGATACYTDRAIDVLGNGQPGPEVAGVVVQPVGRGQIVSLGLPAVLTNQHLGEADNAVLAVALLAPRAGTQVAVLQLPAGSAAHVTLGSLISVGVKLALVQLVLALIVYLFVRGRRLGKPIVEAQPVQIPGSELVSAVGNLLQQTKSPDRSAAVLRGDLRRRLSERLGLPPTTSPEVLAATVEARVGIPQDSVLPVVADFSCPTEADLLALSARIDELRRQVLGGR